MIKIGWNTFPDRWNQNSCPLQNIFLGWFLQVPTNRETSREWFFPALIYTQEQQIVYTNILTTRSSRRRRGSLETRRSQRIRMSLSRIGRCPEPRGVQGFPPILDKLLQFSAWQYSHRLGLPVCRHLPRKLHGTIGRQTENIPSFSVLSEPLW